MITKMEEKRRREPTNICRECGAENTLWPHWIGRKRAYKCEACGKLSRGVTRKKYQELHPQ